MKLLISPAKSMNEEVPSMDAKPMIPPFLEEAEYLMSKLIKKSARQLKSMMGISDALAELNVQRNASWSIDKHVTEGKPAGYLFNGDVYLGLDIHTLENSEVQYLQDQVFILSGLYGLLKPLDFILPYRLEMGSKFEVTKSKNNLYKYWGNTLCDMLNALDEPIVNLASNEYFKAVVAKNLKVPVVNIEFKEEKDGAFKMVGFFAKKARGMMVRFAALSGAKEPADLKGFNLEGYSINESLSTEWNWVYTRPYPISGK